MRASSSSRLADWQPVAAEPPQSLPEPRAGFNLGVSISDSPDLARLGLTETHLRMALGEVARATLIADGRLSYGGHLRDDGYTSFLVHECEKYRRRDKPFTGYVPWSVHRALTTAEIAAHRASIGMLGKYVFLDPDGTPIVDPSAARADGPEHTDSPTTIQSLTRMREYWTGQIDGRLIVGGQREGFQGRMPGVVEEAILAIRANKPLFVAGGFGGAAADVTRTLGLDPENWLGVPDQSPRPDLAELRAVATEAGWDASTNGLSEQDNHHLAISYRASEIASLVVVGLTQLRGAR